MLSNSFEISKRELYYTLFDKCSEVHALIPLKKYLFNLIKVFAASCRVFPRMGINELKSIKKWFGELKPSNLKHITKYLTWKKFKFCPPNTTPKQREEILKNKLNPYSLYKPG